jgi:hypothetical protein
MRLHICDTGERIAAHTLVPDDLVHHHLAAQMDASGRHESAHHGEWTPLVHCTQHVLVPTMANDYAPSHIQMRLRYLAQYIRESRDTELVKEP